MPSHSAGSRRKISKPLCHQRVARANGPGEAGASGGGTGGRGSDTAVQNRLMTHVGTLIEG